MEALNSDADRIRLVLNRRKGFIKMALRFGVDLVPSFSFGENFIYDQVKSQPGKVIHYWKLSLYYLNNYRMSHIEMDYFETLLWCLFLYICWPFR